MQRVKVKVEVQGKHVHNGKCGDAQECAIALALIGAGFKGVSVYGDKIAVGETRSAAAELGETCSWEEYDEEDATSIDTTPDQVTLIDKFDSLVGDEARQLLAAELDANPLVVELELTTDEVTRFMIPEAAAKYL